MRTTLTLPRPHTQVALVLALLTGGCGDMLGTGGAGTPVVGSVFPANGATDVSVLTTLRLKFSVELDHTSVADAVSLRAGNREIRTKMVLHDLKVLHLEPTDPLDFGTTYRLVVATSLKSRSGKPLSEQQSWEFTTEGSPPPSPDPDSLRATLEALAHDSMMGRGSGTEYEQLAAGYLQDRFVSYGLGPPPGGHLQTFQALSRKTGSLLSSQNVLAVVQGSGDLVNDWLVVGAHYDHIGLREQDDGTIGINNGADDNGSGTVLILEMARVFQAYVAAGGMPTPNRRSVLFAAFGAEEEGLLGSCHYAFQSPAAPISVTRAMMNFDMVGRLKDNVLLVRGFESSNEWANMVVNANSPGLILFDPLPCDYCSDFACFRDQGIPYVYFFTHGNQQYHSPADDVERINFKGLREVGEVSLRVVIRLAVMPEAPTPLLGGSPVSRPG